MYNNGLLKNIQFVIDHVHAYQQTGFMRVYSTRKQKFEQLLVVSLT